MNELYAEKLSFDVMCPRRIKKIKLTSDFANYLVAKHPIITLPNTPEGIRAEFTGIPFEVDDDILNDYYELVF